MQPLAPPQAAGAALKRSAARRPPAPLSATTVYTLSCTGTGGTTNQSATVTVTAATTTLAAKYPGDIGIGADPAVIWDENFSEGSVSAVAARYSTVVNTGGMALVADIPTHNAASTKSISMISGGSNDTTYLYRNFPKGYDEIYVRYYAKYVTQGPWHHVGMVFGGYNPSLSYPYPKASDKPAGNDSFHIYYDRIAARRTTTGRISIITSCRCIPSTPIRCKEIISAISWSTTLR